jgi:hypothetical protein
MSLFLRARPTPFLFHGWPTCPVRQLPGAPSPVRPAARHGRATPPSPVGLRLLPAGRRRSVGRPPLCLSLSLTQPSPTMWCHPTGRPPPLRAGLKRSSRPPHPLLFPIFSPLPRPHELARHPSPPPVHRQ